MGSDNVNYVYSQIGKGDLKSRLEQISNTVNDSFGIFFNLGNGTMKTYSISPPSIELRGDSIPIESGVFEAYEIYLSEPSFLNLKLNASKGLDYHLSNLSKFLLPNEKVVIQLAARKIIGNAWRENLLGMYSSYLNGNDTPITLSVGRRVQEKTISLIGRIGNFELGKEYISEVDEKLLDTGYEFKMVIGIRSRSSYEIIERVNNILKRFDSYNSLRLHKIKDDSYNKTFELKSSLLSKTPKNILSEKELFSVFVGNTVVQDNNFTENPKTVDIPRGDFDFLPEFKSIKSSMNEMDKINLISKISEALKKVNAISTARLFNEKVTEGVRLITVQFDIPKNKNYSDIQKKKKDIQVEMGIISLSIEQGDKPGTIKFLIPNNKPSVVGLRGIIELDSFKKFKNENKLAFIAGVDELSQPIYLSLTRLVHLLVAGTTGSGKSVFINSLATTLLSTHSPHELQMVMIDPKMVELQHYKEIAHVRDVITDMNEAERVLSSLVSEMDKRYKEFQRIGVKNIELYNESSKRNSLMPYLVCIIDEYADLKDTNPDVEEHIGRLGQKTRASGIHMVIATQRPDSKMISGRIKAVIPNAISFSLNNNNDYRTVFGCGIGDVTLLGLGDGIMKIENGAKHLQRFQSCIISPDESKEEEVYRKLAEKYQGFEVEEFLEEEKSINHAEVEVKEEESELDRLKKIIATTKETRMSPLRRELGGRMENLSKLMQELVDEGWLLRHENRSKGYELIVGGDELNKWR